MFRFLGGDHKVVRNMLFCANYLGDLNQTTLLICIGQIKKTFAFWEIILDYSM